MEILILLLFVSLVLACLGVGFFIWNLRQRTHEHTERMTLLPLDE